MIIKMSKRTNETPNGECPSWKDGMVITSLTFIPSEDDPRIGNFIYSAVLKNGREQVFDAISDGISVEDALNNMIENAKRIHKSHDETEDN